jgi:hypothetical protein
LRVVAKTKTRSKKISKPITSCGQRRFEFGDVRRSAPGLSGKALAVPGIERWTFDLARVQLVDGERLRRAQATTESRLPATTRGPGLDAEMSPGWFTKI